ncbi:hypothetical protein BDF21DRAFT_447968 [Thamnidium elegans]|nr:hypothetical protein BDF21DRAFT_447968 [Thamnidium elegans]
MRRAENRMRENSLKDAANIKEWFQRFQLHKSNAGALRNFYDSPSRRAQTRHIENRNKSSKDTLCSNERRFVVSSKENSSERRPKPITFIGDSGLGVGSKIERFRGSTHAFITSDYMNSQTCMFCFCKLAHPSVRKTVDRKLMSRENRGVYMLQR